MTGLPIPLPAAVKRWRERTTYTCLQYRPLPDLQFQPLPDCQVERTEPDSSTSSVPFLHGKCEQTKIYKYFPKLPTETTSTCDSVVGTEYVTQAQ